MKDAPIYWTNPHKHEFQVTIVSCTKNDEIFHLGIRQHVIRPAGGGQAGDKGTLLIDNAAIRVYDASLIDGVVTLVTDKPVKPEITGFLEIDMNWRRASMRNHTAEHIFMSAMKRIVPESDLGYIWIDGDRGTVDIMGSEIGLGHILESEKKVQDVIASSLSVISELVPAEELPDDVRAREGITDKHDIMRIISVGDFDKSACSGIHVSNTGDIGVFKVRDFKPVEGGVRVEFLTGSKAISELSEIYNQVLERKQDYPYEMEQVGAIIDKAKFASKNRAAMIERISDLIPKTPGLKLTSGVTFIHHYLPGFDAKQMKPLIKKLKPDPPYAVLLFAPSDKPTLIFITSNMPKDASEYVAEAIKELGGKGGGSRDVYTGGFSEVSEPAILYEKLVEWLGRELS